MPRQLRPNIAGLFFHVMARGNNRTALFRDDRDRRAYLKILEAAFVRYQLELHTICLMDTHVHLLVRNSQPRLPMLMQRAHSVYAQRFNARHSRTGHLFERRYEARVIEDNRYLFEVCRYIHMNPVEAGIASTPEEYRWSSIHQYLEGRGDALVKVDLLLQPFQGSQSMGKDFLEFTMARMISADERGWASGVDWYSSSEEGVLVVEEDGDVDDALRSVDGVLGQVARVFKCDIHDLKWAWRNPKLKGARGAAAWVLRQKTNMTLREVAKKLRFRTESGVLNSIARFRAEAKSSESRRAAFRSLIAL